MDIYYIGESLPFAPSMRGSATRDFEKFPIGSLERSPQFKSAYAVAQGELPKQKISKETKISTTINYFKS